MKYNILFEQNVTAEIQLALDYYKDFSEELSQNLKLDFADKLALLENNPFIYQLRYKNIRMAHLKKFPYSLHYFIEEETVYVLRFLHQKQFVKGL